MLFSVEVTRDQYERLLSLAKELGVEVSKTSSVNISNDWIVPITLIRTRACEHEIWADQIAMRVPREIAEHLDALCDKSAAAACKEMLLSRIQDWLATPKGWVEINTACHDFNWGDWMNSLMPYTEYGIYFDHVPESCLTGRSFVLCVDQDELLAPTCVPSIWTAFRNEQPVFSGEVFIDFTDGNIQGEIPEKYQTGYSCYVTVMGRNDVFYCDPNEDNMRLAISK